MKRIVGILIFVLFTTVMVRAQFATDQLIVQFHNDVNIDEFTHDMNNAFGNQLVYKSKELSGRMNMHLIHFDTNLANIDKLLGVFGSDQRTIAVQPNHTNVELRDKTPNDLDYPAQWALNETRLGNMAAPTAWDYSTGDTTSTGEKIVIAVVDNGFDLNHQDLSFFENTNEIPNNNIDDDQNGYVDDVNGWNAYNDTNVIPTQQHGTHVTGIAAAKGDNNQGVTGVGWGMEVLPIAGSSGSEAVVLAAYGYILEMRALYNETDGQKGAFVVAANSSFGINFADASQYPLWCNFYDSLGAEGVLSTGATINGNIDIDQFGDMPTTCSSPYLLSVTNLTEDAVKNAGAGYGTTHIDIAAPGTDIYSTVPSNSYSNSTGTSMAAPQVAGAIGLLYSAMCPDLINLYKQNPDSIALYVRESILKGADTLSLLQGTSATEGKLNLTRAIEEMLRFDCTDISFESSQANCEPCGAEVIVDLHYAVAPIEYYWNDGLVTDNNVRSGMCAGNYSVTGVDRYGNGKVVNIEISQFDSIVLTSQVNLISAPNAGDGSIQLQVSGGNGNIEYEWSTGDTTDAIQNLSQGNYQVTVTDSTGCSVTKSFDMFLSGSDELTENDISIYPNPTKGLVTVRTGGARGLTLDVLDVVGKVVLTERLDKQMIDLTGLPSGLYIFKIHSDGNPVKTEKVIVR
ncbi:S8 family serine peptidase [Salibacter halophilus]|uniref:S8 family serine peptidase n=1 Tax=Salibacter halophilus TaxID=1803916 RepID=A0A6N6M6B1_9FLAO|nr:S8 family serine peptidase [Salibacter halophilus]KAB1065253.1 S8 family serine peptidase [Salibacter halophilus]